MRIPNAAAREPQWVWLYQSIPRFNHQVYQLLGRVPAPAVTTWKPYFETHSPWFPGTHFNVLVLGSSNDPCRAHSGSESE
jgi:hypothetical protein